MERKTGLLTDVSEKRTKTGSMRTELTFIIDEAELKVSAFCPPNLPELKQDREYTFGIVENQGYLNLAPLWKDNKKIGWDIFEAAPNYAEPEPKRKAGGGGEIKTASMPDKVPSSVWAIKDYGMMRGGMSHDAATIVAALIGKMGVGAALPADDTKSKAQAAANLVIEITDQLTEAAQKRENALRAKLNGEGYE
jgi:hypothetical protein